MKMKKVGFSRWERLLNLLGLYDIFVSIVDNQSSKKKGSSNIYKTGTTSHIIKYFDGHMGHNAITKTGNLGFGFIHSSFINALKPERVLCIGSKQGYIPAICALACKFNQHGHVDFVDAGYGADNENDWGGDAFWVENDPKEHYSLYGINQYLTTYVMTSKKYAQKFPKRKYQYIYIDGDHSYEGVRADHALFWSRLAHGGFMVFHDITTKGVHHDSEFGVWKFWQELKGNKIEFVDGVNAMGVIQK